MRKKTSLPDPGLTGEVKFSHCLFEILTLSARPGAERRAGVKALIREISTN